MGDRHNTLKSLERHRDNLAGAKTLEEYRDAHIAWVNYCIEREKVRISGDMLAQDFLESDGAAPVVAPKE